MTQVRKEIANTSLVYSHIYDDCIHSWHLPGEFSQGRIGGRSKPSNACTFIALTVAQLILREDELPKLPCQRKPRPLKIYENLLLILLNAILEGNSLHQMMCDARNHERETFTIPQALNGMKELHEIDFMKYKGYPPVILYTILNTVINHNDLKNFKRFCFVLITAERAIQLTYDRRWQTLYVFDSHAHEAGKIGPIISAARLDKMLEFSVHLFSTLFPEMLNIFAQEFEISCLQLIEHPLQTKKVSAQIFPRKKKQLAINCFSNRISSISDNYTVNTSIHDDSGYESEKKDKGTNLSSTNI